MKQTIFLSLIALISLGLMGCKKNNETVEEPQVAEIPVSPCALYVGDCGDTPDWSRPMGIPARITADDRPDSINWEDFILHEKLQAAYMGENQLRIIWQKVDQCLPKIVTRATLEESVIQLFYQDTASRIAECECVFPLYFDFDSLAYGLYTIIAGDVEHHIDFQEDMEQYEYEYE